MTTQPETRLMVARREWDLAKDADDLQRAAWAELHGKWLMIRVGSLRDALTELLQAVLETHGDPTLLSEAEMRNQPMYRQMQNAVRALYEIPWSSPYDKPVEEQILSVSQTALRAGVQNETVRRWIASGILPAMKLPNGYYRIKEQELQRMLKPVESSKETA